MNICDGDEDTFEDIAAGKVGVLVAGWRCSSLSTR
jgi:hypothetical protein